MQSTEALVQALVQQQARGLAPDGLAQGTRGRALYAMPERP